MNIEHTVTKSVMRFNVIEWKESEKTKQNSNSQLKPFISIKLFTGTLELLRSISQRGETIRMFQSLDFCGEERASISTDTVFKSIKKNYINGLVEINALSLSLKNSLSADRERRIQA